MRDYIVMATILMLSVTGCKQPAYRYRLGTSVWVVAGEYAGCGGTIYSRYLNSGSMETYNLMQVECNGVQMPYTLSWMSETELSGK